MKTYGGSESKAPPFIFLVSDGGVFSFMLRPPYSSYLLFSSLLDTRQPIWTLWREERRGNCFP
jgi:hypothetical protein